VLVNKEKERGKKKGYSSEKKKKNRGRAFPPKKPRRAGSRKSKKSVPGCVGTEPLNLGGEGLGARKKKKNDPKKKRPSAHP